MCRCLASRGIEVEEKAADLVAVLACQGSLTAIVTAKCCELTVLLKIN